MRDLIVFLKVMFFLLLRRFICAMFCSLLDSLIAYALELCISGNGVDSCIMEKNDQNLALGTAGMTLHCWKKKTADGYVISHHVLTLSPFFSDSCFFSLSW